MFYFGYRGSFDVFEFSDQTNLTPIYVPVCRSCFIHVPYVGGFSSENKKWDHVYSIMSYHTDGYQDNSDWDKMNAAGRITYHFTDAMDGTFSISGVIRIGMHQAILMRQNFIMIPNKP